MSNLTEIVATLTQGRKRKEDQERFAIYEELKEKRDDLHLKVRENERQWELHLGQAQEIKEPTPLNEAEEINVELQTKEFIHAVNVALTNLKPSSTVWLSADEKGSFIRQAIGDVIKVKKSLVVSVDGKIRSFGFFTSDENLCSDGCMLPSVIGELSAEATLQAYRDMFRANDSKRMFNEA